MYIIPTKSESLLLIIRNTSTILRYLILLQPLACSSLCITIENSGGVRFHWICIKQNFVQYENLSQYSITAHFVSKRLTTLIRTIADW